MDFVALTHFLRMEKGIRRPRTVSPDLYFSDAEIFNSAYFNRKHLCRATASHQKGCFRGCRWVYTVKKIGFRLDSKKQESKEQFCVRETLSSSLCAFTLPDTPESLVRSLRGSAMLAGTVMSTRHWPLFTCPHFHFKRVSRLSILSLEESTELIVKNEALTSNKHIIGIQALASTLCKLRQT